MRLLAKTIKVCDHTHSIVTIETKDGIEELDIPASFISREAIFVSDIIDRIEHLVYVGLPCVTNTGLCRVWVKQQFLTND
jgi:hypothetical protein